MKGFDELMEADKASSRASWTGSGDKQLPDEVRRWAGAGFKTPASWHQTPPGVPALATVEAVHIDGALGSSSGMIVTSCVQEPPCLSR